MPLYSPITLTGNPRAERRILSGKEEDTRNVLEEWCLESELGRATECAGQRDCRSSCRGAGLGVIRGACIEGVGGCSEIQGLYREPKPWAGGESPFSYAPLRLKSQVRIGKELPDQTACGQLLSPPQRPQVRVQVLQWWPGAGHACPCCLSV